MACAMAAVRVAGGLLKVPKKGGLLHNASSRLPCVASPETVRKVPGSAASIPLMNKHYEAPSFHLVGSVADLTRSSKSGTIPDGQSPNLHFSCESGGSTTCASNS